MLPKKNVTLVITCLTVIVTSLLVIIFPLGYFYISYLDMSSALKIDAELNANIAQKIINANPEYWQFEKARLYECLSIRPKNGIQEIRKITNNKNEIVAESVGDLVSPVIMRSYDIMDSGLVAGKIKVYRSLRPVINNAGLIALLIIPFGLGAFIALRIMPIRAISRIEKALKQSYIKMEKTVEERTAELRKTNKTLLAEVKKHKLTHEALRRSEEQYRALVETSTDAIITTNGKTEIIQWNSAASRIFGYKQEEIIGKSSNIIVPEKYFDEHISIFNQDIDSVLSDLSKYTGNTVSLEGRTKEGIFVPLELTVSAYKREGSLIVTYIVRDMTVRRRLEEKRRELETKLQRAEKMEAIGILAGGVAHDLNNVIGVVIGYAELLLTYKEIDASDDIKSRLMTIIKSGERAAAIVYDMLTLARRGVHTEKVLNLNTAIMEYQSTPEYQKLLSFNPNILVNTQLKPDLPNVLGSPVHFGKTIMNLVSNAAEAMPKGGTLTIKTDYKCVESSIQGYEEISVGDYVIVSISDTGEGISNGDLKHIFEPFYTKKIMGKSGTGLGLSVVWGTIKDYNGHIDIKSDLNKGTTFNLYFPSTQKEISSETTSISVSEYMGHGESIIVVDDIKEQREMAASMLASLNYNVMTFPSGEEAVGYLKRGEKADLILLDMIMNPGMDGLDTYKNILNIRTKQKAIIVSGLSETDRVCKAKKLGVSAYIQKPYMLEKLGSTIKESLTN
ncbi:MAG: PAS domain S-box protein [Pseudomonadota bacterium]